MPFGLKNAPATFQQMIDSILGNLIGKCCVAYLNDVLIFSPDESSHKEDVVCILECLQQANLFLKESKCEFFKSEVTFLGNVIFRDGHAICPDKIAAILSWPKPKTFTNLRAFLGSLGFLC